MQHNQILNGARVIFSPFIGVQLTSWKARTQPQVPPFLKVATEMALHVLAYNLTRVLNIVGVKPLIAAMRA